MQSVSPVTQLKLLRVTSDIAGVQSSRVSSCTDEDGRQRNLFRRNINLGPGDIFDGRKQEM